MTTLYTLVEIRPNGHETELYLGTKLKDGTRTKYTVDGNIAYQTQKKWEEANPNYRYEVRLMNI
jgi:predicted cupin superfamily sugar epimerase